MCFVIAQMVSFHGNIEKSFLSILLMNSFVKSMKNRKKEKMKVFQFLFNRGVKRRSVSLICLFFET